MHIIIDIKREGGIGNEMIRGLSCDPIRVTLLIVYA